MSLFGINDCHKPKKNTKKNYWPKSATTMMTKKMKVVVGPISASKFKNYILFPSAKGQTKGGVDTAPAYLSKYIHKGAGVKKVVVADTGDLMQNLADLYKANAAMKGKRVNIGGDHSMSIATIAYTLNAYPGAKVIYFDAHGDINTYKSSKSKHYHGMPLSFVTGLNSDKHFSYVKEKLPFADILYIGSRCWDRFEVDQVYKHNIRFLEPAAINNDFANSLQLIRDFVGSGPVHVSFDVDSIDPKYIPSTGTPVKNGLELSLAKQILKVLYKQTVNLDITELNMALGPTKKDGLKSGRNTVKLFREFL